MRLLQRIQQTASTSLPPPPTNRSYVLPHDEAPHEGTWLQWPHNHSDDRRRVERYERIWIEMTKMLHGGERVHIVAYDATEQQRIVQVLTDHRIDLSKIDFLIAETDDVWIRDNGPIFVKEPNEGIVAQSWEFNGWGRKRPFRLDNQIPEAISHHLGLRVEEIPMINEGGSIEVDGCGTLMAKESSIINRNRNPGLTRHDAEAYFRAYLGVKNFIWLKGRVGGGDITDDHIDGTARFAGSNCIVTHERQDFLNPSEYDVLSKARNADGVPYKLVHLPLTSKRVRGVGEYGIYINYYVGNDVVLVPVYNDRNDSKAIRVIQDIYPKKHVHGIEVSKLYKDGGALHCVTMQQPARKA